MKEDIIRMAREAGFADGVAEIMGLEGFARFAALVAAAEREACAKVCDEAKANIWEFHPYAVREAANNVCTNLAAAIRARGQS